MNKFKKVLLGVGISVLCLLSVSGCGKKKDDIKTIDKNTIYREEELKIPFEDGFNLNTIVVMGDKLVFTGYVYNDETWESKNVWGTVNYDGSEYKSYTLNSTDGWVDYLLPLDNGNIAIVYSEYFYDDSDPDNFIYENNYYLSLYDGQNGSLIKKVDVKNEFNLEYLSSVNVIGGNTIYVTETEGSITFDSDLNVVKQTKNEDSNQDTYYSFYNLRNNKMMVSYWGDQGQVYAYYDKETGKVGDTIDIKLSTYNYSFYSGAAGYDLILRDSLGVYGYNIGDSDVTPLLNFINSDISTSYFDSFNVLDDKSFIGTFYDWESEEYSLKICKYTKVAPEDVKDKKIISLGCLYLDSTVRKNVLKFNKTSDEYRIVITDYSKYDTEDDWEAGSNKFNTDIASGNGPDIICADGGQISRYQSKGVFCDLTDYFKNDPDVKYEDLFPNLLSAASYDGKIYQVVPYFSIDTLIGKKSVVGDRDSWTFSEFASFAKSLPAGMELFSYITRDSFLYYMLSSNSSEYINVEKGEVYFDSEAFISLLEFLTTLPTGEDDNYWEDYDWEAEATVFRENRAALNTYTISYIEDYLNLLKGTFGEDITFIGYPSENGNGSSIYFSESYAISSKCKYPDAAWEVIKYYISDDYQQTVTYGIPASMTRFDSLLGELKKKRTYTDYDGVVYDDPYTYYMNGVSVELDPLTDAEAEKFKNFVLSVSRTQDYISEIETIVSEEAAAFFEGQKSASEVAKIIQSRASIYIKEIR